MLDQTSKLPVKLRCRFAIRYLQYAVDRQVLVCRHPILQEKTTPRYSQLAITHRTHSPMLQKVSKMSTTKNKKLVIGQLVRLVYKLIHLLPFRSWNILFPYVHRKINLLIFNTACNEYFASPEINDLWQIIITSSMGKHLMV